MELGSYRDDGPDTMFKGAVAIGPHVKSIRERVFGILDENGGCTDPELVAIYRERFNPEAIYRSLGARRRELVIGDRVEDTGRRRINEKSGIQNIVWGIKSPAPIGVAA